MTAVDLSVVGAGLVSPSGATLEEHVFFLRAESTMSSARAFVDAEGELLGVVHCPWLDPSMPLPRRIAALARGAARSALAGAAGQPWATARLPAMLVTAAPWSVFSDEDAAQVEGALKQSLPLDFGSRLHGAAGFFHGLAIAHQWLASGSVPAVVLVTADSWVGVEALSLAYRPARRWERVPAYLAEGAAALVLVRGGTEADAPCWGRIRFAAARPGTGRDDDDVPVDGAAMTALVREAVASRPFSHSFGQHNVDALRHRTFAFAGARTMRAFEPECRLVCVEDSIGRVGAAAGGVHLAYGLGIERHGAALYGGGGPFLAWAVSADGTRGLAVAEGPVRNHATATGSVAMGPTMEVVR